MPFDVPLGMLGDIGFLIVLYLVCAELLKRVAIAPSAGVVAPRLDRAGLAYETLNP